MDLNELRARIDPELWAGAKRLAWDLGPDAREAPEQFEFAMVPHELEGPIWEEGALPEAERLALALAVLEEIPSYAVLMYVKGSFDRFDASTRGLLWRVFADHLAGDREPLAEAVSYSLAVDFFEDPTTVEEAWRGLLGACERRPRCLERILSVSGPVPWQLKAALYEELLSRTRWHPFIAASLVDSQQQIMGQIDGTRARAVLDRIEPNIRAEQRTQLRTGLGVQ